MYAAPSTRHDGGMPAYARYYTWREAVLQAMDAASLNGILTKPRVSKQGDWWYVNYRVRLIAMNASPW